MRDIFPTRILELVVEVVITIRQAQPALAEIDDVLRGIPVVLMNLRRIRRVDADAVQVRNQRRDLLPVLERVDARELGVQRLEAEFFELCLIHETVIQVANLLRVRAGRSVHRLRHVLDDGF